MLFDDRKPVVFNLRATVDGNFYSDDRFQEGIVKERLDYYESGSQVQQGIIVHDIPTIPSLIELES